MYDTYLIKQYARTTQGPTHGGEGPGPPCDLKHWHHAQSATGCPLRPATVSRRTERLIPARSHAGGGRGVARMPPLIGPADNRA